MQNTSQQFELGISKQELAELGFKTHSTYATCNVSDVTVWYIYETGIVQIEDLSNVTIGKTKVKEDLKNLLNVIKQLNQ